MGKITPHLWFDTEAKEAAAFYASLFPNSKIGNITTIHGTPSGDCDIVSFELSGQPIMAISAGPLFKFNPSVSFQFKCNSKDEVDVIWKKLSGGGKVRIPLGSYPFSERYGWMEDRYGLSWQLIFTDGVARQQRITPVLVFAGRVCGKAEEAINFYALVFKNAPGGERAAAETNATILSRYGKGEEPKKEGTVKYASFTLLGQEFGAMDSPRAPDFAFNEAISFMVPCETQEQIDHYWGRLSADPTAEQCGWLKDRYGLSWQVTPAIMQEMLAVQDREKMARVTQAFLKMKKFDIDALRRAYEGR